MMVHLDVFVDVLQDLRIVEANAGQLGLELNKGKS